MALTSDQEMRATALKLALYRAKSLAERYGTAMENSEVCDLANDYVKYIRSGIRVPD